MFVSSYTTYIQPQSSQKEFSEKKVTQSDTKFPYAMQLKEGSSSELFETYLLNQKLPISYLSKYKVLNNKQKLQESILKESPPKELESYHKQNTQQQAQTSYKENTMLFVPIQKVYKALESTEGINTKLSKDSYDAQKALLREKMLNTYRTNQNYYKLSA
ncbi:MAG: hypothetical protein JXQ67_02780 [Campylobacterales bacterium]|nr:hypothetical protein [Campylobacterales bacterium]